MSSPPETLRQLESAIKASEKMLGREAVQALLARTGDEYVKVFGIERTGKHDSVAVGLELIQEDFEKQRREAFKSKKTVA